MYIMYTIRVYGVFFRDVLCYEYVIYSTLEHSLICVMCVVALGYRERGANERCKESVVVYLSQELQAH